ncbi:phosphatidylcholine translocator ABCB4-like [Cuculus canorus]|uniref:phosphatidylcholine translocator ABCB4-like n=1 Tax=Cuculus canorus TaxID=55661 RepID=UPI0023AB528F|nr:phosphatidylcholine translocator ABCB4-like [Cuculus canorus]
MPLLGERKMLAHIGLGKARRDQTTPIVAHRLSTAQTADVIVGIVDGAVVEMGTHTELMEKKEPYYSLATSQESLSQIYCLKILKLNKHEWSFIWL